MVPVEEAPEESATVIFLAALQWLTVREARSISTIALKQRIPAKELLAAYERLQDFQAQGLLAIPMNHPGYPDLLKEIPDPPALLFYRGNADVLRRRCVAVVGARRATSGGLSTAREVSAVLASRGLTVVSGLALGIDAAAHHGALEAGGTTAAVFGCGISNVYPATNRSLAERIVDSGGLLLSEYDPEQAPRKHFFPERNRIISGLCEAVIVIEAGERSGSLVTARMALEQGRDVLAVPGSIHVDQSRGCHRLIREGAALLDSVETLLEELNLPYGQQDSGHMSDDARRMWDALDGEPLPLDVLATRSQMTLSEATLALVQLELAGFVDASTGEYSRRASSL